MSRLIVSNIETQNIKFDSDTTAFTIGNTGNTTFSGSVIGAGPIKVASNTWSSAVSQILFTNCISTTYNHYMIRGSYVDNTNHKLRLYIAQSGADATGTGVYQGGWGNRAASASMWTSHLNGSNAYSEIPMYNNSYGGTVVSFEIILHDLHTGFVSGTTNMTPHRIRNGRWWVCDQSVTNSDRAGHFGWLQYQQANAEINDVTAVTDLKFALSAGNFERGNIAVYGFN